MKLSIETGRDFSNWQENDIKIMTPGPTQVAENVRMARSLVTTNPDIDEAFYDFSKETCELIANELHTANIVYIMGG